MAGYYIHYLIVLFIYFLLGWRSSFHFRLGKSSNRPVGLEVIFFYYVLCVFFFFNFDSDSLFDSAIVFSMR